MVAKQIEFFSPRQRASKLAEKVSADISSQADIRQHADQRVSSEFHEGTNNFLDSQAQFMFEQSTKPSRFSRDEMNLAEFPLSVLSTRVSPGKKTLEFEDTVIDKNGNHVSRQWIITAADKFGLPTASDDEILLGLLKISVDKGLDKRKVYFTRYELLRTLNWTTEGRSYKRLTNALDRLSGVRIKATNSFYDNESKAFSTRNFGIIDEYEINSGKTANAKPSFFVWSEVLHKSFSSGFIKKLDFDFFLRLESAVSKRLYRFLDKHFWYRSKFSINLFTLAHEKIGVSRTYQFPSSLRQQLDPAMVELIDLGFLSHVEYAGKGKATTVTFYAAGENGRRSQRWEKSPGLKKHGSSHGKPLVESHLLGEAPKQRKVPQGKELALNGEEYQLKVNQHVELEQALVHRGVHLVQARRLCESLHRMGAEERARSIVKHFDFLVSQHSSLVSRNPAGFLYRALENPFDFVLPEDRNGCTVSQQRGGEEARHSSAFSTNGVGPETKPKPFTGRSIGTSNTQELNESLYLTERKREIARLLVEVEPALLKQFQSEVVTALENIRDLVSESGFREAVKHGVEEKIAKLFAIPDFDEWKRRRK